MTTTTLKIQRPNGNIEYTNISERFPFGINKIILDKFRAGTRAGGKGEVLEAIQVQTMSNLGLLMKKYNNLQNEGGYGYVPDEKYFKALPEYKEWEETTIIK